MGAAYFYHLTRAPLAVTLATLAEKSLAAGWRVDVRGRSPEQLKSLDAALWLRDGFLPHGIAGGTYDADQPVLLSLERASAGTSAAASANAAQCVMSTGGADISPEEIAASDRTCILFDGHDETALAHARGQWKALTNAGVAAQYWSEESGKWEKKAESPKPE